MKYWIQLQKRDKTFVVFFGYFESGLKEWFQNMFFASIWLSVFQFFKFSFWSTRYGFGLLSFPLFFKLLLLYLSFQDFMCKFVISRRLLKKLHLSSSWLIIMLKRFCMKTFAYVYSFACWVNILFIERSYLYNLELALRKQFQKSCILQDQYLAWCFAITFSVGF